MLEKELANKLLIDAKRLEEHNTQSLVPVNLNNQIDSCNFELLQQECNNLGFHICYMSQAPFDSKFYKRQSKYTNNKYLVYTDKSITNINYY